MHSFTFYALQQSIFAPHSVWTKPTTIANLIDQWILMRSVIKSGPSHRHGAGPLTDMDMEEDAEILSLLRPSPTIRIWWNRSPLRPIRGIRVNPVRAVIRGIRVNPGRE
jgi:hypothetical protein